MTQHWNNYWIEGFITSFGKEFDKSYNGIFKDFWNSAFSRIVDNSRVLDLATGNAGVPIMLLEYQLKTQLKVSITGTDIAKTVNKESIRELAKNEALDWSKLKICNGVDSAKLPFEDNYFDYVISQYGFEYSEFRTTMDEVLRVLKPKGRIAFLIHANDSVILKRNSKALSAMKYVFQENSVFSTFIELIESMGNISSRDDLLKLKSDVFAENHRNRLNHQMQEAVDNFGDVFMDTGFADLVGDLMSKYVMSPISVKRKMITGYRAQLIEHSERLEDLVNAAYDETKLQEIQDVLLKLSYKVDVNEVTSSEGKLGWSLLASAS